MEKKKNVFQDNILFQMLKNIYRRIGAVEMKWNSAVKYTNLNPFW